MGGLCHSLFPAFLSNVGHETLDNLFDPSVAKSRHGYPDPCISTVMPHGLSILVG